MSVVYQLTVSAHQAESFLKHGIDFFGGLAVDANEVSGVTDVADLITLLNGNMPGSPYKEDQPLYILHVPTNPFIQARLAVGPLDKRAFLGGIVELDPFDGSGVARAGNVSTPLIWIEPTRLSQGSQLWRFEPGNPEPTLCGVYHGVTWGWENVETGEFRVGMPTQFVGPVIRREWGVVPVDVELNASGTTPVSVTMVAPAQPPEEDGFEAVSSGMWAKRLEYNPALDIFEYQVIGRSESLPIRVLRAIKDDDALHLQAHITPMIVDAPLASAAGFQRYTQGVFTHIIPMESIKDRTIREARPGSWDVRNRPAVTVDPARIRDNGDTQQLLADILALMTNVAPSNWTRLRMMVQLVDRQIHFAATADVPGSEPAGAHSSATGQIDTNVSSAGAAQEATVREVGIKFMPTAVLHYCNQIKEDQYRPGEGAAVAVVIEFNRDGKASVTLNLHNKPRWADKVTAQAWKKDLIRYPRNEEHIPAWMKELMSDGQ
ncbi:hypothetical protein [Changpingibacter yushuensis]|uniref:hypothetical protein n=1 Tax=Changpingibacter yushuensis TaxID=2758440 RepID=UPI0015F40204|nr:hypothetical protein [Changpingibacter yushuensis]